MSRTFQLSLAAVMLGLLAGSGAAAASTSAAVSKPAVSVSLPGKVKARQSTAITVRMSAQVAAVEGRVFVAASAADVIGIAPVGKGTATRPIRSGNNYAFAAYGLTAVAGHTTFRIIVFPKKAGYLQVRVSIDATADKAGTRITSGSTVAVSKLGVGSSSTFLAAPAVTAAPAPTRAAGPARKLVGLGKISVQDLDAVRGDWYAQHLAGSECSAKLTGDANGDGCVDAVDLQAELAAMGQRSVAVRPTGIATVAPAVANHTFTVNSTADTPDATNGDGICADTLGQCTLRAAMTEANWSPGDDRIEFALAGTAPVTIQVSSQLPNISSRAGTLTIDGYTQPGSRVNTASVGSNAILGAEVRGNGSSARELGFYITSAGNTIRGLLIDNFWDSIFLDMAGAHDNKIIGNWIGFNKSGASSGGENFGVVFNIGANHNFDGTPDLADRNVIGNVNHAEENYGPGTDFNTTQNNVMCMGPSGFTIATCATGIDHNFGPKSHLIGGSGPNEKNVIGPTTLQGIEFSHGWNQSTHEYSSIYAINNNQVIGNWVGFRGDGSYSASYRSGLNFSSSDNGQGINVYDGSNFNTVDSNYIGSVYNGVQIMSPNATGNIVRNNTIGVSPAGEAAPLTGWGIVVRWGSVHETLDGNTIRNAAAGGFGLLNTMNNGAGTSPAYYVRITHNIVSDTSGPAIGLFGNADDNSHLPPPVITSAGTNAVAGTGLSGSTVELYRASRPAGQTGLPIEYLGSTTVAANKTWTIATSLNVGNNVTALQIVVGDNTSQLAINVAVGSGTVNRPPVFNQDLGDRTDAEHDTVSFSAAATDPDNDTLSYSATGLPGGVTIDPVSGLIGGTLSYTSAGSHSTVVRVTDGQATTQDSFTWTVSNTNRPPTATVVLSPTSPDTNGILTATATATDPDGDAVSLTYTWKVNGTIVRTFSSASALTDTLDLSVAGNGDLGDVVRVAVVPNDGTTDGTTASDSITVADATTFATDAFGRTVSNGWGAADLGGNYTVSGTVADYAVNGSVGTISLAAGANRSAILAGVSKSDVDLSFRFALNKLPVGSSQFLYGLVRRVSSTSEYRAEARIAPNGSVFIQGTAVVGNVETGIGSEVRVTGLTVAPDTFIWMRVQVSGASPTTIQIRVWADGSPEPTRWQYTATDSTAGLQVAGALGIRAYEGRATTNGPIVVKVDDLHVIRIP